MAAAETLRVMVVVTNADLAGAPIHVRDLVLGLQKRGVTLSVVFGEHGPVESDLRAAGVDTHVVPTMRSHISPVADWHSFRTLLALGRIFQPDLVHVHSSKAGLIGRLVASLLRVPSVYTVHGWGFGRGRRIKVGAFVFVTEWLLAWLTKRFITVSGADRQLGLKFLPIRQSRIRTIYNATPFTPSPAHLRPEGLHIIMVARDAYPKDYGTLFKALNQVSFDSATVVGEGTQTPAFIEGASRQCGAAATRVRFLGLSNGVEDLLENASVVVLSSRFEGLPISLIEAMSKGLPVVASRVGGIPELVDEGRNGYLFEPGDADALAGYLNRIQRDPSLRISMGQSSLEKFQCHFSMQSMIEQTVTVYKEALPHVFAGVRQR
jgi:glycosyltransferase involved in cell wall biosynthesis